jgi:hypothetical protein
VRGSFGALQPERVRRFSGSRTYRNAGRSALRIPAAILLIAAVAVNAAPAHEKILYSFHSPGDIAVLEKMKNVRISEGREYVSTIVRYPKPRGIAGSRNYVEETRFEDSGSFDIKDARGKILFEQSDQSEEWGQRSTATKDSYFLMQETEFADSAPKGKAGEVSEDATYDDHIYPYVLIEIVGRKVRAFDCTFDTTRMTSASDRKFLRTRSGNDPFVVAAQNHITGFLAEHGAAMETDGCEPMKPRPDIAF